MPTDRRLFAGVAFDPLSMDKVVARMSSVTADSPFGYVVTPNVDHVVRLNDAGAESGLSALYDGADLSLCDSRILAHLARWQGVDLPVVAGSDLTVRLLDEVARAGDRIAIVGGDRALLQALGGRYPHLEFVHYDAPHGLRHDAAARDLAARFVAETHARFSFIAVGSPQQEMVAAAVRRYPQATGMAFCIGASLDFITGHQRRAPKIMQQLSLEWLYRLLSDPKRMWRRYLIEGPRIFRIAARTRRGVPKH